MGIPASSVHEANFDYLLKSSLDELIANNPRYSGLKVELQPSVDSIGRADLIIKDGLKPFIVFETKKSRQDVDSIKVHRKAREYAMTLKTDFFVVSNARRTYLFKNDMGPLRELQIKLWESSSQINVKLILDDVLTYSLNGTEKQSRKEIFLNHYERIYNKIVAEYGKILHSPGSLNKIKEKGEKVKNLLTRAEKSILNYMGVNINAQNIKNREETILNLATQASYLLLNKIFCYEVIRTQFHKQFSVQIQPMFSKSKVLQLQNQLNNSFKHLIQTYDFAPIFKSDGVFSEIPFSSTLNDLVIEFIEEISEFDLENLEEDFIGEMYQKLIPIQKKKALGQIYTPVDIAKLMVDLAIKKPNSIILDPACGCGTFLKEIYHRLHSLNMQENASSTSSLHLKLLSQIWGVEINSFPAHLSMMNLTFMNLNSFSDLVGILIQDFLDMGPMEKYNVTTKNLRTGEKVTRDMPRKFDVILANPPYVKQEKIPKKKLMLKKLPEFASYRSISMKEFNKIKEEIQGKSLINPKKTLPSISLDLKGQTDYYGYFLWYSTFFLKDNGILCFIVPNKWMDVKYGLEIKEFILSYYCIKGIIGFTKNVFPNAQVSTVILLLKREKKSENREINIVNFISLSNSEDTNWVIDHFNQDLSPTLMRETLVEEYIFSNPNPNIHCTLVLQSSLRAEEKWSIKYLYQSEFIRLLSKVSTIKMGNGIITSVIPGLKSGANAFYFPSKEDLMKYKIESQFLKPGIKSGRDIPNPIVISEPPMVFLSIPFDMRPSQNPGLLKYIQDGKSIFKYHERPSVKWKPWYSIPETKQDIPDILFLRHIDSDFVAHLNQIECVVADGVRGIKVHKKEHILFYLGVLNSTYFYWQAHINGRWEGQGDLQLLVYELQKFDIPDITKIEPELIEKVEKSIKELMENEEKIVKSPKYKRLKRKEQKYLIKLDLEKREKLDLAVLDALGLSDKYDVLINEATLLETLRLTKSGN